MRTRNILGQFVLLALAWGTSFLFIKIGLRALSPAQVVLARLVFGALALGTLLLVTRRPVPREPRVWAHLTVVAALLCVLPFLLFSVAEQRISSGLASILNATTPLLALTFAAAFVRGERITRDRGIGLGLGFAGVLTIIGPWHAFEGGDLLAELACLGATTCYGLAFAYLRRFLAGRGVAGRGMNAASLAFGQVLTGAVLMLLVTPWLPSTPVTGLDPVVVLSMLALGAFGTGFAYVWNNNIVAAWGAANAAAVTYLSPVVGVLLGVLLLDEPLNWNQPLGAVLVVLGILAAHGRLRVLRGSGFLRGR